MTSVSESLHCNNDHNAKHGLKSQTIKSNQFDMYVQGVSKKCDLCSSEKVEVGLFKKSQHK